MGIQGLLPQLKSVTAKAHVSKYRGQRAAVDAYVLLHRGAYTCAREICEGEPTDRCTEYCMGRIQLLLHAGVIPVVVFDGGRLPNKDDEERSRARSRDENRAKARALWQQGNKTAAFECYQRAVDISPGVAKGFIDALKRQGVHFIVAPYEADAQMAYLAHNGQVDVVITEDSDLLAYGCPRVFFKMDKSGDGEEVELKNLVHARELSFLGFTQDMFLEMCILAGCDFVKALPGVGIKKAHQQIRQRKSFIKVIKNLRFSGTPVPQDYERRVQRAIWTFHHQRVYCPQRRMLVHLRDVPGGKLGHGALVPAAAELADGEDDFLGPLLADDVAQAIATGHLDPITKLPYGAGFEGLPCTAPQQQDPPSHASQGSDADPGFLQNGRQQQQRWQQQGLQRKGKDSKGAALGNSGNTLANYGFLRHSGSAMKEFKQPRSSREQAGTSAQHQQEQLEGEPEDGRVGGGVSPQDHNFGDVTGADPGRRTQPAFLGLLQSAEAALPAPCIAAAAPAEAQSAGGQGTQQRHGPTAVPMRSGISGLMAKLRADLHGPGLNELLHGQPARDKVLAAPDLAATAQAGCRVAEHCATPLSHCTRQPSPLEGLGLRSSPTIDQLLTRGGREHGSSMGQPDGLQCIPDSPAADSSGAFPPQLQQQQQQQHGDQQVSPGFYAVGGSDEQPGTRPLLCSPQLLEERTLLGGMDHEGSQDPPAEEAADAAMSSLEHLPAFAQEAKAAVDRIAVQAVRESAVMALQAPQVQPPAYLQRRQQLQQTSTAALKRPFSVPRRVAAPDKENSALGPAGKRGKPEAPPSNMFSKFACK